MLLHWRYTLPLLLLSWGLAARADKCLQTIKTMENFKVQNFTGNWLVYMRYPTSDWFERCTQWKFEDTTLQKSTVNLFAESRSETNHETTYVAPGEFDVQIRDDVTLRYKVLDTDYHTYAVFYTCIPVSTNHELMKVWILTNATEVNQIILDRAYTVLERNNLTRAMLKNTTHEDCFILNSYADRFWILVDKTRKYTIRFAKYILDKIS